MKKDNKLWNSAWNVKSKCTDRLKDFTFTLWSVVKSSITLTIKHDRCGPEKGPTKKKQSTERDSETNDLYRKQLKESTMQFQYQHGIAKLVINQ